MTNYPFYNNKGDQYNFNTMELASFIDIKKYPSTLTRNNFTINFTINGGKEMVEMVFILANAISFKNDEFLEFRKTMKRDYMQRHIFRKGLRYLNQSRREAKLEKKLGTKELF